MKNTWSTVIFCCLEGLLLASFVAFLISLIVPDLFSICVSSGEERTCASFGVFDLNYRQVKMAYEETTGLFMGIRVLVFFCTLLVLLSAIAAPLGYLWKKYNIFSQASVLGTMVFLIILSILYTIQWCQSKLTGSSFIVPFRFHELRPISQNLSFPFLLAALYPMILIFCSMGVFIQFTSGDEQLFQRI
ncbi:hypothetical protein RF11_13466 [Thelohanellus kitauei]|uniref:Uncharacterized protein n=1 Tax=Thelohanellus kitauei TaxID=669202 RepID=A0A0C2MIT6_THEKT|nr:hypothetical protein RF11_13466 [Thelohanellus kitauei]